MSMTIALAMLATAAQLPEAVPAAPAATCPKGLAGLACKAQRLNAALQDPSIAEGMAMFAKFTKKKPKPVEAVAAAPAEPAPQPVAEMPADPAAQPAPDAPATDDPS